MKLRWKWIANHDDTLPMRSWVLLELFHGAVRFGVGIPRVESGAYAVTAVPFVMVRPSRFGW